MSSNMKIHHMVTRRDVYRQSDHETTKSVSTQTDLDSTIIDLHDIVDKAVSRHMQQHPNNVDANSPHGDVEMSSDTEREESLIDDTEFDSTSEVDEIMEMYNEDEMEYIHGLSAEDLEKVRENERAIKAFEKQDVPMRFRILNSTMDIRLKSLLIQKMNNLASLDPGTGEHSKLSGYINALSRIPLGNFKPLPIQVGSCTDQEVGVFLSKAQAMLD